jgi:hypothetical protein
MFQVELRSHMPVAKRVKSPVAAPKRVAVATAPHAVAVAPVEHAPTIEIVDVKIAMLPDAAAPSFAEWQSFAASIARVESRGYRAPTVRVDPNLRGATIRIAGRDATTAIHMVRLFATNSPSPPLWQSRYYEVTVIDSEHLP